VSLIKPFRALRPRPDIAKQVSSVPYDVVYEQEARDFIRDNPYSFLRITRPEAEDADCDSLESARQNLERFVNENVLTQDETGSYFVYRLTAGEHSQTGVVACCSLDEYEAGLIKKHEKTRPDKVEDRTRHMVALRAQTGLIFLAYRGRDDIKVLCDRAAATEPIYDFECTTGVRQTVWRCNEVAAMTEAFRDVPALYVADGHHRLESALHARNILRDASSGDNGTEEYNFVLAGLFPAEQLQILAYNRVVSTLNGLSKDELLSRIGENFIATECSDCRPDTHGEICMYFDGTWYDLRFAVEYFREPDPIERLDVTILQKYLLEPVFGISDPRTDERIGFVGGGRGMEELRKLVDSGQAAVAFALYPTTMDDLLAVSDMDAIMPPKSTWFEPKLKDGLFVHLI
jgi:uncharacterized protein (DUF1015 family)